MPWAALPADCIREVAARTGAARDLLALRAACRELRREVDSLLDARHGREMAAMLAACRYVVQAERVRRRMLVRYYLATDDSKPKNRRYTCVRCGAPAADLGRCDCGRRKPLRPWRRVCLGPMVALLCVGIGLGAIHWLP